MIALLGDLKGVKNLIETDQLDILRHNLTLINEAFSKAYLIEKKRSRTLKCCTFSDSILATWDSNREGIRNASEFACLLWKTIDKHQLPYRIFIDGGNQFEDVDNLSNILSSEDQNFNKIFPVSISIWSIFLAEASKFPNGIFIGKKIYSNQNLVEEKVYKAGEFEYYRIKD